MSPVDCLQCDGMGYTLNNRGYAPCDCPAADPFWRSASRLAGVPKDWRNVRLEGYEFKSPAQMRGFDSLEAWQIAVTPLLLASKPLPKGYMLHGSPESGKSRLAAATANSLIRKTVSVAWVNVPEFYVAALSAQQDPDSNVSRLVDGVTESQFIVLDDLGAEKASEFAQGLLYLLLNRALEQRRAVLATSNLSFDALEAKMDPRNVRRLKNLCDELAVGK